MPISATRVCAVISPNATALIALRHEAQGSLPVATRLAASRGHPDCSHAAGYGDRLRPLADWTLLRVSRLLHRAGADDRLVSRTALWLRACRAGGRTVVSCRSHAGRRSGDPVPPAVQHHRAAGGLYRRRVAGRRNPPHADARVAPGARGFADTLAQPARIP